MNSRTSPDRKLCPLTPEIGDRLVHCSTGVQSKELDMLPSAPSSSNCREHSLYACKLDTSCSVSTRSTLTLIPVPYCPPFNKATSFRTKKRTICSQCDLSLQSKSRWCQEPSYPYRQVRGDQFSTPMPRHCSITCSSSCFSFSNHLSLNTPFTSYL